MSGNQRDTKLIHDIMLQLLFRLSFVYEFTVGYQMREPCSVNAGTNELECSCGHDHEGRQKKNESHVETNNVQDPGEIKTNDSLAVAPTLLEQQGLFSNSNTSSTSYSNTSSASSSDEYSDSDETTTSYDTSTKPPTKDPSNIMTDKSAVLEINKTGDVNGKEPAKMSLTISTSTTKSA